MPFYLPKPLSSRAIAMIPRFRNASLLEIEAEGHCSFSRRSACAAKTIRRYLESGDVPITDVSNGTWLQCEANETPWFPVEPEAVRQNEGRMQVVLAAELDHDAKLNLIEESTKARAQR